jgi:hypothetical protein
VKYSNKKMAKNKKSVSRAYGGVLSGGAVRERIVRAFLVEEQKIVKVRVPLTSPHHNSTHKPGRERHRPPRGQDLPQRASSLQGTARVQGGACGMGGSAQSSQPVRFNGSVGQSCWPQGCRSRVPALALGAGVGSALCVSSPVMGAAVGWHSCPAALVGSLGAPRPLLGHTEG